MGAGADLSAVRLGVAGAERVAVEGDSLRLDTAIGPLALPPLLTSDGTAWQPVSGGDGIRFAPQPSPLLPVSLDRLPGTPGDLVYSLRFGGNNTDVGNSIAVDASGAAYVTGLTTSPDFPTTPGAFQTTYGGGPDKERIMSMPLPRLRVIHIVLFICPLTIILLGWWLAQASFTVTPTTYAPLAVKNLSSKRGCAGASYVPDLDYLGATWFYGWGPDWPWLFHWDPPGNSYGANPHNAYQFVPMLWCWWQLDTQVPTVYRDGPVLLWNEPADPGSTQCGQHYLGGPDRWEGTLWPTPGPGTPTPTP